MNIPMILYILGRILQCEAALLALPLLTAFFYHDKTVLAFLAAIALCFIPGLLLTFRGKPQNRVLYMRDGFTITALSWILISIMGALPFLISGAIKNPVDALFETVSGFTTTGASILIDVEALPKSLLFWRSFTHWIGGMGVLVFLLSLLPLTGGTHVNLMKAESPGPQVEKLTPKVQSTAKILYGIYIALTVLEIGCLLIGGMSFFDAITTAFGTAGTGGFGVKNDSLASYSPALQIIVTIFMILFGVNFNFYFLLLLRKFRRAFRMEEIRSYFLIIFAAILLITFNIRSLYGSLGEALRQSAFQVGSIITTTGFSTTDFNLWPQTSKTILVLLMFVGACAGSTGGGIKVSRVLIFIKTMRREFKRILSPQRIENVYLDGKPLPKDIIRTSCVFLIAYILIFTLSHLLISFDNYDFTTNFTAVAATLNNIGPGLEMVGPVRNFSLYSAGSKLVLIFDMLAGRLELFPLLILFMKEHWRRF